MKRLFLIIFIASIILTLVSLAILPPKMAIHFTLDGSSDGWASKQASAIMFGLIKSFIFFPLFFIQLLIRKSNPKFITVPNKNYWLQDESRPRFKEKVQSITAEFGSIILLFISFTEILTIKANLEKPALLNNYFFYPVFILFMLYTVYWVFKLFLIFKFPKTNQASS